VLSDARRVGDRLVLKSGVKLHMPRLVDLLGRQERRLFLAAVRAHEPREPRRDPLSGHHQR
jgi:hypothetical protein